MRQFKWIFIAVVFILAFNACSSDLVYEGRKDFNEQKWMRFQVDTFRVQIKNIDDSYDLYLQYRFTSQVNAEEIPVIVKMYTPSGEMRNFLYNLRIKNKSGHFEGDKIGAIYDGELKMREHVFFNEPGEYQITTQQVSSNYEIHNFLGIGLKAAKSKIDYSFKE